MKHFLLGLVVAITYTNMTLPGGINVREMASEIKALRVKRDLATEKCVNEWLQLFIFARQAPHTIDSLESIARADSYMQCMDHELGINWTEEDKSRKYKVFAGLEKMLDAESPGIKILLAYGRLLNE